jgi:pimeloyl-ACP methyl ester carboxylesterase
LVETAFGQTFVRINGAADAPPLVLLPGFGANSLMWLPNIEDLSRGFRTYAVDSIYDNGRSIYTRPLGSARDFVTWMDGLFTTLALGDRINLLGVSYGGWLIGQYALRFPNRLAKMVWLAPAATVLPLRLEFWVRALLCLVPLRFLLKSFMYWIFEDAIREDGAARGLVDQEMGAMQLASRCFKARGKGAVPTVVADEDLRNLHVPTLCLIGEHEKIYSAQKAVQRLNRVAPQIKTEIVPGAGHDLSMVQANLVNQKVLEFLQQP